MTSDELRALVREYLATPEYPEGWIEPDEISDAGAPDLLMARELWRLVEQYEVLKRERDEAVATMREIQRRYVRTDKA